ncbi:MAG: EamA family transporter [Chloroflexi bacterium]|nr:EamA family transporter [Chloroflexota bacterium]
MTNARLAIGYGLALSGAALYALGGILAKLAFAAGFVPSQLAEIRAILSFLVLLVAVAVVRPALLRVRRSDLPLLLFFGVVGIAAVNGTYYEAIARLPIGVALVIQYTAPVMLLVWARLRGRHVGGRLWIAAALTLVGCYLVVGAYDASLRAINAEGAAIAIGAACIFALYLGMAEKILRVYSPWTLLLYGLGGASIGWSVLRFPTLLPWGLVVEQWPLVAGVLFVATLVPYVLTLGAVSLLPAARVGLTATFEPVVGAVAALVLLGELLQGPQWIGGALVLVGIGLAQTLRPTPASV